MNTANISIITATFNCATALSQLIDSLLAQSDQDFDWVVVDGASTDNTIEIVKRFPPSRVTTMSAPDFGIYDALNKGVANASGQYYLVVGADDQLHVTAIENFRKALSESGADIVSACVQSPKGLLEPMKGHRWLRGGNAYVSSHSVGTLIRRDLHKLCGYYSNRYPNCADMHFILSAVTNANASVYAARFVAGTFGETGISTVDHVCSVSDAFRIQLYFGENKAIQLFLCTARLIRALAR